MRGNTWDIFCNVVDNFGDAGVCWRLARQLATEHHLLVRLWIDDLRTLSRLCPEIDVSLEEQVQRGVHVRHWVMPFPQVDVADVVVEAFACELPDSYLSAMAARPAKPAWINLEYLSAEEWVNRCHGLASPHPSLDLTRYFFFPGFGPGTGGLLRESSLFGERDASQANPEAALFDFGLRPADPGEASVSLFCYENPALPQLLRSWTDGDTRLRCLIPDGKALHEVAAFLGNSSLKVGDQIRQGNLTLCALPFFSQEDYDHLLWSCDLNFVRGEDSFVRAQWAARPLVWQIYPQGDAAHGAKLNAFLARYCQRLPAQAASACSDFWMAWNTGDGIAAAAAWPGFWRAQEDFRAHARYWSEQLAGPADMARQLVLFCKNLL